RIPKLISLASGGSMASNDGSSSSVICHFSCNERIDPCRCFSHFLNAFLSYGSFNVRGPANVCSGLNNDGSLMRSQCTLVVVVCLETTAVMKRFCASTLLGSKYGFCPSHISGVKEKKLKVTSRSCFLAVKIKASIARNTPSS